MKEDLRNFWERPGKRFATAFLNDWMQRAKATGVHMLQQMARTLETHRSGLVAYYDFPISTGPLEGTNHKIKTMKTAGLWLPRPRVLQTQDPGNPRGHVRFSRMSLISVVNGGRNCFT
jgi:hypothetical protein